MAFQGLAKGQDISTIGRVWLTWYTGKSSATLVPGSSGKVPTETSTISGSESGRTSEAEAEEEMVVRGWGGDDDGDGMGML